MKLTTDCPKHGSSTALPIIEGAIRPHEEWPKDVHNEQKYRRVCIKCLAEAMVSPIRRRAA